MVDKSIVYENIHQDSSNDVNKIVNNMTLFDDDLMSRVFDKNIAATELVLRIILGRDIKVIWVKSQVNKKNPNPNGRSITIDIEAIDIDGSHINIEVQGDSEGAHVKRARYHSSMLDVGMLKKNQDFKQIKDSYVIFIYRNDKFGKGLPLYHIERYIRENAEQFEDGSHIIYVNGTYKGDDNVGKLMNDFRCKSVSEMWFKPLADGVKHFKNTEKGRETMCEAVEQYAEKYGEKVRTEDVKNLMTSMNLPIEKAMDILKVPNSEREAISAQLG